MGTVLRHGEHGLHAIVAEDVGVPVAFFVAAGVDGADAAFDAVEREFVWS